MKEYLSTLENSEQKLSVKRNVTIVSQLLKEQYAGIKSMICHPRSTDSSHLIEKNQLFIVDNLKELIPKAIFSDSI